MVRRSRYLSSPGTRPQTSARLATRPTSPSAGSRTERRPCRQISRLSRSTPPTAPGLYKITITATEAQCNFGTICGKSSTANVSIIPMSITFENLPTAVPAASGGLPTVGTGSGQINPNAGGVTVAGYATSQDPATYVLSTPANKLNSDAAGKVLLQPTQTGVTIPTVTTVSSAVTLPVGTGAGQINLSSGSVAVGSNSDKTGYSLLLSQAIPTTGNTPHTVADCLNAARADGFGKWTLSGTALTLFAADGTTAVRTFTLDSATSPSSRT